MFESDINAAVDAAVSGTPASSATTTEPSTPSPSAPAETPLTSTPAAASGPDAQSSTPRKTDEPTIQAGDSTTTRDTTQSTTPSEPPREKWDTILTNARNDRESEVLQSLGVPQGADRAVVKQHMAALFADPVAYHRQLTDSLTRAGMLRGDAPQPSNQPIAQNRNDEPITPDLRTEDGTGVYSERAMARLLEQQANALRREFSSLVNPLQEAHQHAQIQQINEQAMSAAKSQLDEAMQWDGFKELQTQIREAMARDGRVTLESAYARLYQGWRKEQDQKLRSDTRQAVLAEIQKAPVIANTANPGATTPVAAKVKVRQTLDEQFDEALSRAMATS